jgi:endonuclease/exonuclease/phosphatase family metal-dependent hydrolase
VFAWVLSVGCGRPSNARKAAELPAIEAGPAPEPSDLPLVRPALVAACSVAAEAPRLRAASWNMRAARSASLDAVAEVIAQIDPDVIALQEVDVGVLRTGRVDQPALLAQRLGYHHAFAASIEYQGGVYGLAVLSRLPFRRVERLWLDAEGSYEPRIALDTTLCFGSHELRFVNHHGDIYPGVGTRNLRQLTDALREQLGRGLLLVGDFNQPPSGEGPRALSAAGLTDLMAGSDATTIAGMRLDYLFADTRAAQWAGEVSVVATDKSDHAALHVDLLPR